LQHSKEEDALKSELKLNIIDKNKEIKVKLILLCVNNTTFLGVEIGISGESFQSLTKFKNLVLNSGVHSHPLYTMFGALNSINFIAYSNR
jgi:hypothetical protein